MGSFYGVAVQNGVAVGLGSLIALGKQATPPTPPPPAASYLLLEDASFVLLEDSSKIELE
jgi:hypothetical protein